MESKTHWEKVYRTKSYKDVSWYQPHPTLSMELMQRIGIEKDAFIIDVGGGASTLVDDLLSNHFTNITVLDVSATALEAAQKRIGNRAREVTWLEADVLEAELPKWKYDLWHDRAVFHFLTKQSDRHRYIEAVEKAVKPGAYVVVATFGPEGPTRCSGLDIIRYSPEGLHTEFGGDFDLMESRKETHITPSGTEQQFVYCCCLKRT